MKNLLFLLSFLLTTTFVSAQMTTWTWDLYKVQFQAPSNFKVSKNDKSGFSAGNGHINLTIYPEKGSNASLDDMAASLERWANSTQLSYDGGANMLEDLNGYWGCYIDGTASNGNPTTVMLLADPDYSEIGLYMWIQYQSDYFDQAVEIARSFMPN